MLIVLALSALAFASLIAHDRVPAFRAFLEDLARPLSAFAPSSLALAGGPLAYMGPRGPLFAPDDDASGGGGGGAGGGAGSGGGGDDGAKGGDKGATFDQAALNAAIAKERKTLAAKHDKTIADLNAKIADLEKQAQAAADAKALEGKEGIARDLAAAQATIKRLEADLKNAIGERDTRTAERDGAITKYRNREAEREVAIALSSKGALGDAKAIAQATRLMMADGAAEITEGDDGRIAIAFTLGGKRYDDVARASEVWLSENPHFAKAPSGGSGSKGPTGGGRGGTPIQERNASDLLQSGWKSDPSR